MKLEISVERFALAQTFTISRGSKTEAVVVVAALRDGEHVGRGEAVPYARYGESVESVVAQLAAIAPRLSAGLTHAQIGSWLPAGAARNALDCALWDLRAKQLGSPLHRLIGLPPPSPTLTAYTISLDTPERMAQAARAAARRPLLKLKLGTADDRARLEAVRQAVPDARLIVDANEGWRTHNLAQQVAACVAARVELIEQPLPADDDEALRELTAPIAICADESTHGGPECLPALSGKYTAINVKLDKAGGLTTALELLHAARSRGMHAMLGCMVATSLALAPAVLLAPLARWVDLDGALWLARDRTEALRYDELGRVHPPSRALWG
ncbi:MAG: dipeptide epimerase [Casimicrobiaceae bacterium]|nr:dipeptide epimerase [Casimicrobiaceae bacterium]